MRAGAAALVSPDGSGLHVPSGGFHIDPWRPVERAVITHAHSDHARPGSTRYLCSPSSAPLLRRRLGDGAAIETLAFGQRLRLGDVILSLHPAGHILGSAQVRLEAVAGPARGEVWAVTGDFKRAADPTAEPFEPVPCGTLITEATFALPIYRWPDAARVAAEIVEWWEQCRGEGRCAILCCYALGKAQRILAEIGRLSDRLVYLHGALLGLVDAYREWGIVLPETRPALEIDRPRRGAGELILAPPSAVATPWARRFGDAATGFASGWMQLRGVRRRRGFDRGFVLSDHADWTALLATIEESGCERVLTTHGYGDALVRLLRERGRAADVLQTAYGAAEDGAADDVADDVAGVAPAGPAPERDPEGAE